MPGVTLQVNVAPSDAAHAETILPHQLRQLGDQVDEIVFTLDERPPPRRSRFARHWQQNRLSLNALLARLCRTIPRTRVDVVDYSPAAVRGLGQEFFGTETLPTKDSRGGPFLSYFHGIAAAEHDYVFHIDADMLFGGGSPTWIAEAVELLAQQPDVLLVSPLPGPPRRNGTLRENAPRTPEAPNAFRFDTVSSRLFLVERKRLLSEVMPLHLDLPLPFAKLLKASVQRNPRVAPPEMLLEDGMRRAGLWRIDFLGAGNGMWSLHPPYRSPRFTAALPELVDRIERGDVPDGQRGDYDLNESLFSWSGDGLRARLQRLWY